MSEGSRPKGVSPVIGFFPPCVTAQPLSLQGHIPHRPWRDIALKGINSLQGYTPIGLYPYRAIPLYRAIVRVPSVRGSVREESRP